MKRSTPLRQILEAGSSQAMGWMAQAQNDGFTLKSLQNAHAFLTLCIQCLQQEQAMRRQKKKIDKIDIYDPMDETTDLGSENSGPATYH